MENNIDPNLNLPPAPPSPDLPPSPPLSNPPSKSIFFSPKSFGCLAVIVVLAVAVVWGYILVSKKYFSSNQESVQLEQEESEEKGEAEEAAEESKTFNEETGETDEIVAGTVPPEYACDNLITLDEINNILKNDIKSYYEYDGFRYVYYNEKASSLCNFDFPQAPPDYSLVEIYEYSDYKDAKDGLDEMLEWGRTHSSWEISDINLGREAKWEQREIGDAYYSGYDLYIIDKEKPIVIHVSTTSSVADKSEMIKIGELIEGRIK